MGNNFISEIKLLINYPELIEYFYPLDTISFKMTFDIVLSILSYADQTKKLLQRMHLCQTQFAIYEQQINEHFGT